MSSYGLVKFDGGAVGLTENPTALKRWIQNLRLKCCMLRGFETVDSTSPYLKHHEQLPRTQMVFHVFRNAVIAVVCMYLKICGIYFMKSLDTVEGS